MSEYLMLIGGLAGLFFGGEALVRGSVGVARRLSMSSLLIGLTVVGFGTSTPELLVSMDAALRGVPDIALGNVVGSNIANILLIVGVSALVWPIVVSGETLKRDTAVMLGAAIVLVPSFALGETGRVAGGLMVGALVAYLVYAYRQSRPDSLQADPSQPDPLQSDSAPSDGIPAGVANVWLSCLWVVGGLAMLMIGAHYLVDGAVTIARTFGVSEAFIGLTIVAVGTSLPELATSLIAALRKQSEIAIGNIVGSNIFNVLGILGLTAVVSPIPVGSRFLVFDLPVMIVVTLVLTMMLRRPQIGRVAGGAMLIAYAGYIWAAQ